MPKKKNVNVVADNAPSTSEQKLAVTARINEDRKPVGKPSDEMMTIACHLTFDLRFDDIPDGHGGVKSITFPSINSDLRGKPSGVLLGVGESIAVPISKRDWEALLHVHGRERVFTGHNGMLPCLIPMSSTDEFKQRRDELKTQRDGFEPANPKEEGVEETNE